MVKIMKYCNIVRKPHVRNPLMVYLTLMLILYSKWEKDVLRSYMAYSKTKLTSQMLHHVINEKLSFRASCLCIYSGAWISHSGLSHEIG